MIVSGQNFYKDFFPNQVLICYCLGDECILIDNSDLIHWNIRGSGGAEVSVPSVVFRILPPDARITTYLNRLHTNLEKLRRLWGQKHRMVRYNMILNTMAQIR